jgi:hypothetical protein
MPDSRATDLWQKDLWLKAELARQFSPVSAPDALWNRIHEQRRPLRVRTQRNLMWSVAALALLIIATGIFWRLGVTRDPSEEITSSDAQEIRSWVKAKSNIDIPLPDRPTLVRLVGARIIRMQRYSVAVVNYRVGSESATMLVTDHHATGEIRNPGHASPRISNTGGIALYSWSLGPDDYTIAFTGAKEPRAACLLCHVTTPALMVFR